eukprot:CAMPEP_0181406536 /NCGR_PEP_ID=MMETSP1110-20121109/5322_1 /TAXON_ID=174948 /ORGANISM="Symbiodinium sp., Strain CCMP421" /LENGTH=504 /DNA_ID=CAMNT_0023528951 /DNA_START=33 /DNA_END=1543 /DNA_ORIENTATION=+
MSRLEGWLQSLDSSLEKQRMAELSFSPTLDHSSTFALSAHSHQLPEMYISEQQLPSEGEKAGGELMSPRRISENSVTSYDKAKQEGSKIELRKELHSQTMTPSYKRSFWQKLCPQSRLVHKWVKNLVASTHFEVFFGIVLVINSLYVGAQLQWMTTSGSSEMHPGFITTHIAFASLFTIECALQIFAFGLRSFLTGPSWAWNWLDILVVISSWIELILDLQNYSSTGSNTGVRIVKVFKFTRILQGLRSLRIVRYISGLRILVYSMLDATKSLAWALLLLALIVYVFGVVFANAALDYMVESTSVNLVGRHWGSVDVSITTLYRAVLGGLDWGEAADALAPLGIVWVHVFHFYVGFVSFAILNVMTGVFCNSAIRAAEHDHDIMMQNRVRFRDMASDLFKKMDSGYGQITISEFEKLYDDEDMQAFLDSIEISATDAWTLFASLDVDGDQTVSVEEFTEGCLKLHGPARSVDLYSLRQQNLKIKEQMHSLMQGQKKIMEFLNAL